MEKALPPIPAKRYFTIGEVSELCGVKPYVLRYWEQEFTQLKPMKRRGNRRYYQHHEVLLIRRIRELLYDQGFTISGARNRLTDVVPTAALGVPTGASAPMVPAALLAGGTAAGGSHASLLATRGKSARAEVEVAPPPLASAATAAAPFSAAMERTQLRAELLSIRDLLNA
jgi:DNA-binding transcriptional MerR regulator